MWLLLINPNSGNGRGEKVGRIVKEELAALDVEYIDISANSAMQGQENLKSRLVSSQSFEGLFLVGGDGTLNIAIQELVKTSLGVALIPAGTGNDFARTLNLNLKDPRQLISFYLSNKPALVDVGKVGERYFVDVLSTGFDSMVNERANTVDKHV